MAGGDGDRSVISNDWCTIIGEHLVAPRTGLRRDHALFIAPGEKGRSTLDKRRIAFGQRRRHKRAKPTLEYLDRHERTLVCVGNSTEEERRCRIAGGVDDDTAIGNGLNLPSV